MGIETAASALSLIASVVVTGIAYGVVKEKVRALESRFESALIESKADRKDIRDEQRNFVTYNHLDAVVEPIQLALVNLQSDVKEILKAVSR